MYTGLGQTRGLRTVGAPPAAASALAAKALAAKAPEDILNSFVRALPPMMIGGGLVLGQSFISGEDAWGKVARSVMLGAGFLVGGYGVVSALDLSAFDKKSTISPPTVEKEKQVWTATQLEVTLPPQETNRGKGEGQEYDYAVRNATDKDIAFYVGLSVYCGSGYWWPLDCPDDRVWMTPKLNRPLVSVPANSVVDGTLKMPPMRDIHRPLINDYYDILVIVYQNRDDDQGITLGGPMRVFMYFWK